jgi:hypothetical protein
VIRDRSKALSSIAAPLAMLAVLVACTLWIDVPAARADLDGDRFKSKRWRVRLTTPRNWKASEQSSYPNVLLWMVRQNPPGKILLSAEKMAKASGALDYANRTRKILAEMGFKTRVPQPHPSGAYYLDFSNGSAYLRQALLVVDGVGYALTLSAPNQSARSKHLRAFESVLQSISIDRAKTGKASAQTKPEPDKKKK